MLEISDLTADEANQYLVETRKMPVEQAKAVYAGIGGRVNQLQLAADGLQSGQDLSGNKRDLWKCPVR